MKTIKYLGGSERLVSAADLATLGVDCDEDIRVSPSDRERTLNDDVVDALVAMDPNEWTEVGANDLGKNFDAQGNEVSIKTLTKDANEELPPVDGAHPIPTDEATLKAAEAADGE